MSIVCTFFFINYYVWNKPSGETPDKERRLQHVVPVSRREADDWFTRWVFSCFMMVLTCRYCPVYNCFTRYCLFYDWFVRYCRVSWLVYKVLSCLRLLFKVLSVLRLVYQVLSCFMIALTCIVLFTVAFQGTVCFTIGLPGIVLFYDWFIRYCPVPWMVYQLLSCFMNGLPGI